MKRFYKQAAHEKSDLQGWQVTLDGRTVKTPGKRPLILPTQALAQAIAQEWQAQGDTVVPDTMALTQYACSALDRVAPSRAQVIGQVAPYVLTDLLAYPADQPPELRARQDALWLPLLAQLDTLGWPVRQTSGLMAIDQDPDLGPRATAWLQAQPDMELTAIASLIEASGSLLLTYLHQKAGLEVGDMIAACTLEETYNLERWGEDTEAQELLTRRKADLEAAAQMLQLLQHPA